MEEYDNDYVKEAEASINLSLVKVEIENQMMNKYELRSYLRDMNSRVINMLEKTLKQDKPNKKIINLCNLTIDKILSAYGINLEVTK
ncbi:MAG: hypothetical protein M1416_00225 [Candidatus Pacearchaeota archaeon]|nr:hypothetical protein [Candidatus Pacearchaeota archaeon]